MKPAPRGERVKSDMALNQSIEELKVSLFSRPDMIIVSRYHFSTPCCRYAHARPASYSDLRVGFAGANTVRSVHETTDMLGGRERSWSMMLQPTTETVQHIATEDKIQLVEHSIGRQIVPQEMNIFQKRGGELRVRVPGCIVFGKGSLLRPADNSGCIPSSG